MLSVLMAATPCPLSIGGCAHLLGPHRQGGARFKRCLRPCRRTSPLILCCVGRVTSSSAQKCHLFFSLTSLVYRRAGVVFGRHVGGLARWRHSAWRRTSAAKALGSHHGRSARASAHAPSIQCCVLAPLTLCSRSFNTVLVALKVCISMCH